MIDFSSGFFSFQVVKSLNAVLTPRLDAAGANDSAAVSQPFIASPFRRRGRSAAVKYLELADRLQ